MTAPCFRPASPVGYFRTIVTNSGSHALCSSFLTENLRKRVYIGVLPKAGGTITPSLSSYIAPLLFIGSYTS
jgi:hypothetical protein